MELYLQLTISNSNLMINEAGELQCSLAFGFDEFDPSKNFKHQRRQMLIATESDVVPGLCYDVKLRHLFIASDVNGDNCKDEDGWIRDNKNIRRVIATNIHSNTLFNQENLNYIVQFYNKHKKLPTGKVENNKFIFDHPCDNRHCECSEGKCTVPGFYDNRSYSYTIAINKEIEDSLDIAAQEYLGYPEEMNDGDSWEKHTSFKAGVISEAAKQYWFNIFNKSKHGK